MSTAVDTVLQAVQCLHKEFMTKMRDLQRNAAAIITGEAHVSCLAQIANQFQSVPEIMLLEQDIDVKYDEAFTMCNNQADLKILFDFSKERQKERMSLVRLIMDQISQIASNDKVAHEMKDFINYVRSLNCPCCRAECESDQELCGIAAMDIADIPTATSKE